MVSSGGTEAQTNSLKCYRVLVIALYLKHGSVLDKTKGNKDTVHVIYTPSHYVKRSKHGVLHIVLF